MSGYVFSYEGMGDVRIGGDITGGAANQTGVVGSNKAIGNVVVGGNVSGGGNTGEAIMVGSGEIVSHFGRIASVTIKGSLIAGSSNGEGPLVQCGAIVAGNDLGPIKIGGDILGSFNNPALIMAKGQALKPESGFDLAIESIQVRGEVRFAKFLAGFDLAMIPANADASIGNVVIGGNWVASSIVAGAADIDLNGFGIGDALQATGNTELIARIASITIKGGVTNSINSGDHFGFVAQQIDKLKIGSRALVLTLGTSNDNLSIPRTDDTRLLEVS